MQKTTSRFVTLLVALVSFLALGVHAAAADTVGVVDQRSGEWYLRSGDGETTRFYYGNPGDVPFTGDWDCDGVDTPGLYRQADGFVYLRYANARGFADRTFFFGNPGDVPLAGDFDGDGCDTVSLWRPGNRTVYVINELGEDGKGLGSADNWYVFGQSGDVPLVGDFDGDGVDEVAMHRPAEAKVYIKTAHSADATIDDRWYGVPFDRVVAGDWDDDGVDEFGAFRPGEGMVYLGTTDAPFEWGSAVLTPIAGAFGTLPGGAAPPPSDLLGDIAADEEGVHVQILQQELADKKLYRGPIDGIYGPRTEQAVMAFHKAMSLPRTWDWKADDWARLETFSVSGIPSRVGEPERVEIDLTRQILVYYQNNTVAAIMPVASGNGELFVGSSGSLVPAVTPEGDYHIQRHIDGLRVSYLGELWNPWYFTGGYAVHGSSSVPAFPASHGCVRVPMWESNWLESRLDIGLPLHVFRS